MMMLELRISTAHVVRVKIIDYQAEMRFNISFVYASHARKTMHYSS